MSRSLITGLVVSVFIHGGFFVGGQFLKARPSTAPAVEETPVMQLLPLPPVEPDPPEVVDNTSAPPDLSQVALPTQADVPSIVPSTFVQQIQPPPPPGIKPTGVIAIPTGISEPGNGLQNLFDVANLDQRPEPRFQPRPTYPFELRRAGVNGEVTVGFIVDSNGDTRDAYIIRSTGREFEIAALQVVPKWKFVPGKKSGAAVNTRVTITIPFTLGRD